MTMCAIQEMLAQLTGFASACVMFGSKKLQYIGVVVMLAAIVYRASGIIEYLEDPQILELF